MSFNDYIKNVVESHMDEVMQGMVCVIESFDGAKMRADIRPLYKTETDDEEVAFPIIPGVPVGFLYCGGYYIKPCYVKGDLVWVTFATFDIDDAMSLKERLLSQKVFDLENCSVAYGLAKEGWTAPTNFSRAGLLIGHQDGQVQLQVESNKLTAWLGTTIKMILEQTKATIQAGTNSKIVLEDGKATLQPSASTKLEVTAAGASLTHPAGVTTMQKHTHLSAAPGSPTGPPMPGS